MAASAIFLTSVGFLVPKFRLTQWERLRQEKKVRPLIDEPNKQIKTN
jgi:hypothetical protein